MIRLYHDDPAVTGGPTTADVPEEAVGWMQRCGWYLKQEEEQSEPKKRGRRAAKAEPVEER